MVFVNNRANVQTGTCKICRVSLVVFKTKFVSKITVNIVTQGVIR